MILAKNITYKIGTKCLLDNVSAAFKPGVLNLIIGPNGAGKSTFIKIISGQLQAQSGDLLYGDKPISDFSAAHLARSRAVLSQNLELSFPLQVQEVVMMGRYPHFTGSPANKDIAACAQAMQLFDITELAARDYTTLSGGEKQRVHFARVLSQIWYPADEGFRCLLLDEPLTFLDVHYQYQFMNQVKDLLKAEDMLVIGVVHDLNLASKYADNIVLLNNGKVQCSGSAAAVLNVENITAAYHLTPDIVSFEGRNYLFF